MRMVSSVDRLMSSTCLARMSQCIDDVWSWTRSNRLQLNSAKTEFVWFAQFRRLHHIPTSDISLQRLNSSCSVDGAMTMRTHINDINRVLLSCFSALSRIKSVKRSLPAHALTTLVTALVYRVGSTTVTLYSLVSPTATFSACRQWRLYILLYGGPVGWPGKCMRGPAG